MVQFKLVYFDMPGRAEISRLIFSAAGQEFQDCRIAGADRPKIKPTTMFGQLPLLFVDGKELPQSNAIARYLARTFSNVLVVVRQETGVMYKDLVGGSDWEAAYCDALVDGIWDVNNALGPWWGEKDEAKKAEIWAKHISDKVTPWLAKFTQLLGDGDHFVGGKLTWVDLTLFASYTFYAQFTPDLAVKFPKIAAFCDKIANTPGIKEYLAKHPFKK